VPGLKRTVRIRQSRGGVYPRLIFEFSSVVARSPALMALSDRLRMTKGEGPAMTGHAGD
jgi:hypothetical protein